MTQYFIDPSDWATETAWPSSTGRWTTANHTPSVTVDRDGPFKDRVARISQGATSARYARTFDAVDGDANRAKFDVSFPFRIGASGDEPRFFARASGAAGSEVAMLFGVVSGQLTIGKYTNPTFTSLATSAYTLTAGTWYRMRCYGNGTQFYAKIWAEGAAEPGSWTVGITDGSVTAAGWIGVGAFNGTTSGKVDYGCVAIGTNGDTPPAFITRTEFRAWLKAENIRCILGELGVMDTATPDTIYVSSMPFSSTVADSPASIPYLPVLEGIPSYEQSAAQQFVGQASVSIGQALIDNADGSRDAWLKANFDGRDALFLIGSQSWARYNFRPLVRAVIERVVTAGPGALRIDLADRQTMANKVIATGTIASGAYAGQLKPLTIGGCLQVEPVPTDDSTLAYITHDAALNTGPASVWDRGSLLSDGYELFGGDGSMDASADTFTVNAGHGMVAGWRVRFPSGSGNAAPGNFSLDTDYYVSTSGLTSTVFRLHASLASALTGSYRDITSTASSRAVSYGWYEDLANGGFKLVSRPQGEVRCTATSNHTDRTVAGCVEHILVDRCGLTGYLDDTSFDAHAVAWNDTVGKHVRDRTNALELITELITGNTLSLIGGDRNGLIYLASLDDAPATARMSFVANDIDDDLEKIDEWLPIKSIRWASGRNDAPATEFDSSVLTTTRALMSATHQKFGLTTVTDGTDSPANHALGVDGFELLTALNGTGTPDVVTELDAYRGRKAAVFRMAVGLEALDLRNGDVIEVTDSRYGLSGGVNGQVLRTSDAVASDQVVVEFIVPSYSQAAAP